jgi:hypothetical protein
MKKPLKVGGKKSQQPQSRSKKAPQTQHIDASAAAAEDEAAFASGELSPPINATEDLYRADKIAEAATITLGPPSSTGSDASVPDFLRRTERDAGTFAVIKVERDKGTIHFRLRADIDPGWMIQQHQARQAAIEAAAEEERKLAKVAEFKRKSRPNQLDRAAGSRLPQHKIVATAAKSVGEQQVQASEEPLKQPKSEVKLIRAAPKSAKGTPSVKILKKAVAGKAAQKVGKAREKAAPKLQLRSAAAVGAARKMLVDESLKKRALDKKLVLKKGQSKSSGFKSSAAKKVSIKNTKSASVKSTSPRASRKTPAKNLPSQKSRVGSAKSHSSESSKPKSQQQKQQEKSKQSKSPLSKAKEIGGKLKSKSLVPAKSKPKLQNKLIAKKPTKTGVNHKNAEKVKNDDFQKIGSATLEDKETTLELIQENEGSTKIITEDVLETNAQKITDVEQLAVVAIVEENHLKETSEEVNLEADMVKFQNLEENSGTQLENLEENSKLSGEKEEKHERFSFEQHHEGEVQSKTSLASIATFLIEERRRSSSSEVGFRQRSDSRVTYSNDEFRYYDDKSPIYNDDDLPDELTSALTDDEMEMIQEKMEEKKRKLKKVRLAEYNNAYQDDRSDWENFEVDDADIDISDELMEIFEMRRKKSMEIMASENRAENPEVTEVPLKSSMHKKNRHSTELETIPEEDPSKLKMCEHCGWMVCLFENCKPVETQVCTYFLNSSC